MPSDKPTTIGSEQMYVSCLELAKRCPSCTRLESDFLHLAVPTMEDLQLVHSV